MFDAYDLTSPAQTPKTAPTELTVNLPTGIITQVGVQFPSGCVGLVHARILHSTHQVWPSDPDEDLSSNGFIVSWRESYPMSEPPYELTFQVWNDDDSYPHTITFFIETSAAPAPAGVPVSISLLAQVLGKFGIGG